MLRQKNGPLRHRQFQAGIWLPNLLDAWIGDFTGM
jgi:hypothetical protein